MSPPSRLAVLSLKLAQHRSYDLCTIETGGASIVLYGPNGAGKTNILEAVSMLVPGRGLRRAGAEDMNRRPGGLGRRVRGAVATPPGGLRLATGAGGPGTTPRTRAKRRQHNQQPAREGPRCPQRRRNAPGEAHPFSYKEHDPRRCKCGG